MNNVMRNMVGSMPQMPDPYDMLNDMNRNTMRNYQQLPPQPAYQSYSMSSSPLSAYSTTHYSSSVMSSDLYGRPTTIYESTQSSRYAPGGVQETRSTVRDSRTGLHQMSIGHHIADRAHIMQRSRNYYTGAEEHNDEYVNLEEEEGSEFNREWQRRAYGGAAYRRPSSSLALTQPEVAHPLALPPCEPPRSVSPLIVLDDITSDSASTSAPATTSTTPIPIRPSRAERSRKSKSRRDRKPYHKH